ncbi:hypothetical protein RSAG8_10514, partial [Rhizoctonia solani AG-8 WAC10335]
MTQALDAGAEFTFDEKNPDHGVALAFGSALLLFLEEMPEPVIPYGLYAQCALTGSREQAYEILDTLPGLNANMWISITALLHFFCQQDRRAKSIETTQKIGMCSYRIYISLTKYVPSEVICRCTLV